MGFDNHALQVILSEGDQLQHARTLQGCSQHTCSFSQLLHVQSWLIFAWSHGRQCVPPLAQGCAATSWYVQAVGGCHEVRAASSLPRYSLQYTLTIETAAPVKSRQACWRLPQSCALCRLAGLVAAVHRPITANAAASCSMCAGTAGAWMHMHEPVSCLSDSCGCASFNGATEPRRSRCRAPAC